MRIFVIFAVIVIFLLILINVVRGEPEIWQVLLAEAANQNYEGLYAVACVIRNRGGIDGLSGAERKDLKEFCERQGEYHINLAKEIETQIFIRNLPDITGGATHFESTDFPIPSWAKTMERTCQIGKHIFYKVSH